MNSMAARIRRRGPNAAIVAAVLVVSASCSGGKNSATTDGGRQTVTVFAAASLTDVFDQLIADYEQIHPNVSIVASYTGSTELASQIAQGAPADVFAAADTTSMQPLRDSGDIDRYDVFAINHLEIMVQPGNPKHISSVADLANRGVSVATCDPSVPCGKYTNDVLAKTGTTVEPVSQEANVKGVATKVQNGEVDAGVVYATDVLAAADLADGVPIPASDNIDAEYALALVGTSSSAAAENFVVYMLGAQAQPTLEKFGFDVP